MADLRCLHMPLTDIALRSTIGCASRLAISALRAAADPTASLRAWWDMIPACRPLAREGLKRDLGVQGLAHGPTDRLAGVHRVRRRGGASLRLLGAIGKDSAVGRARRQAIRGWPASDFSIAANQVELKAGHEARFKLHTK